MPSADAEREHSLQQQGSRAVAALLVGVLQRGLDVGDVGRRWLPWWQFRRAFLKAGGGEILPRRPRSGKLLKTGGKTRLTELAKRNPSSGQGHSDGFRNGSIHPRAC